MKYFSNNISKYIRQGLFTNCINMALKRNMAFLSEVNAAQRELLKEECILVDKNDNKIGTASKEICHRLGKDGSPPPLHRAFSVFLFNSENELLLQQRSKHKITFPLHYTNTCCSHPLAYKEELQEDGALGVRIAACRRLNNELGIPLNEIKPADFTYLTRIYYSSPSQGSEWGEHEIDYILFLRKDVTLKPNDNEIQAVKFVKLKEFENFLQELKVNKVPITPWFQLIVDRFLMNWWKNLDSVEEFVDEKNIHYES